MCVKKKISILPQDLIVEILSRISPVKSLMRFKSVCKSWLSLISTDSNFINKHLSHQLQSHEYDLLVLEGDWFTWSDLSFSTYNPKTYDQITTFQFPVVPVECLYVIGTYNGLFLLQITYDWGLMLFNPTTRALKSIPIDQPKHQSQCPNKDIGFGYDSFEDDYKILTRYHANDMPNASCEAFVYSFDKNSWKVIDGDVAKEYDISCSNQVIVNGCIHWLGNCWIKKDEFIIIAFDLHKEEFVKMAVPDCKIQKCESRLGELQGCLSIFVVDHFDEIDKFDIWAMKDYGSSTWTKQITFTWPTLCPSLLGFGRDGKVFFAQLIDDQTRYIWYDPKTNQVIKEFTDEDFDHLSVSFNYIKSLVPIRLGQERI